MACESERHFRGCPPLFGRCKSVDYALFGGRGDRGREGGFGSETPQAPGAAKATGQALHFP